MDPRCFSYVLGVPDLSCLQTMVLCESVTSVEQAFKVLELMVKHQENKAILGGEVDDCKCLSG